MAFQNATWAGSEEGRLFSAILNQAIDILLDTSCYIIAFVVIEAVMAAQSSFEFTSVFREEAVVVFWYLIFEMA